MELSMETGLPWKGNTRISIKQAAPSITSLRIRIPGWLTTPAPGDLYKYADTADNRISITVNGKPVSYKTEMGYAVIEKKWKNGDVIDFEMPMKVRKITSHPLLKQTEHRVALQYGPMIYCVEGTDNRGTAFDFIVPENTAFKVQYNEGMLGGINQISFNGQVMQPSDDRKSIVPVTKTITAIPYFSWNNRGADQMQVWLPTTIGEIRIAP
jgi:DUF1680 family protein